MSRADWIARIAQAHKSDKERRREQQAAEERSRALRWKVKAMVQASHPQYPTITVPHASKFAAILCASEVWGCNWADIMDNIKLTVVDKPRNEETPPACCAANTTQGAKHRER